MMEINTPRELRGYTRGWPSAKGVSSANATEANKFAFGAAFHGLLERLRTKMKSMSEADFEGLSHSLRKIDGKVKDEIHKRERTIANGKLQNKDKPTYRQADKVKEFSSGEEKIKLIATDLQAILHTYEVSAPGSDCLKVVEMAASHGRIVLILESLVRNLWEQMKANSAEKGPHEDAAGDGQVGNQSTFINVASLKIRKGHRRKVSALSLSDDGKTLASADDSGCVLMWHLIDGEQVSLPGGTGRCTQLTRHVYVEGPVAQKALAATGIIPRFKITEGTDLLCSASVDGSICLWDIDRNCLRLRIENAHADVITSVVLCESSVSQRLHGIAITASEDGLIRLWDIRPTVEMDFEPIQVEVQWAIQNMKKSRVFDGMSDGDLVVLLHSMHQVEFEALERILWSDAEIQADLRNKGGSPSKEEEEFERTAQFKRREKSTDVLVLVLSGIAIATRHDELVRRFRPGDCLGGVGWVEWRYGDDMDYNGVAKSKCKCLVLHKKMFDLVSRKQYGRILAQYLSNGLQQDWGQLSYEVRQGLSSVFGLSDRRAVADYSRQIGIDDPDQPQAKTEISVFENGTDLNVDDQAVDHDRCEPSQLADKATPTSREQDTNHVYFAAANNKSNERRADSTRSPRSSPAYLSESNMLSEEEEKTTSSQDEFPSLQLRAAAQMYRRMLTVGKNWRMLAELKGHTSAVTCLALDGKGRLVSGSRDKTLRVWNLLRITEDMIMDNRSIRFFSGKKADKVTLAEIGSHEQNPCGHQSWITSVVVNHSSTIAISSSYDSTLRVWSMREEDLGQSIRIIKCATDFSTLRLERLQITADAEFAFVCGQSGVFQVWRLTDGVKLSGIQWGGLVDVLDEDLGDRLTDFEAISISRDASLVATCRDEDVLLWDSESRDGIASESRGKIIRLPGAVEGVKNAKEEKSAEEYHRLKLEMKGVLRNAKRVIKEGGLKVTSQAQSATNEKASPLEHKKSRESSSVSVKISSGSPLNTRERTSLKMQPNKSNWISESTKCLKELNDGSISAEMQNIKKPPALLVVHSESLKFGKYTWNIKAEEDCNLRVGIVSCRSSRCPSSFDPTDFKDDEHWSYYLESNEHGAVLRKSLESEGEPQEGFFFGRIGDDLTVHLDCKSGKIAFESKRGEAIYSCSYEDQDLVRLQTAGAKNLQTKTDTVDQSQEQASSVKAGVDDYKQVGELRDRRLFAFVEMFGKEPSSVILSKITHQSRIPHKIRSFFKDLSDSLNDAKVVRDIPASEISYKGGSIDIKCRCGNPKSLQEAACSVGITWPRTALPGPTKMEIRICAPPANSNESCEARYTYGIDKLHAGRVVGVVVDIQPHGLKFHLPVTIRIPHAVLLDGGEFWQNQLECLTLDDFNPIMGIPNCQFTCVDGKFDSKYGVFAVKSSGIFGLKASDFCRDLVHMKLYCQPSPTLLEARQRLPPHKRGPEINAKMHEVNSENFPEVVVDSKGISMTMKLCGVFCQDDQFIEVLKAPVYSIPNHARVLTFTMQQHGYALGVVLKLQPQASAANSLKHRATEAKKQPQTEEIRSGPSLHDLSNTQGDLHLNTVYVGGPMCWNFTMTASKDKNASDLVLMQPSNSEQELQVSLKLRGIITKPFDVPSESQIMQFISQKRLQQFASLTPFSVLVKKQSVKAKFVDGGKKLIQSSLASKILAMDSPAEGSSRLSIQDSAGTSGYDLFLVRNHACSLEMRSRESEILEYLKCQGWTMLDLSVPLFDGKGVTVQEYQKVHNCKATLVFMHECMLEEKLDSNLPISRMWVNALIAHGMDSSQRFGGNCIIPVSISKIMTASTGVFPQDDGSWKGQIGERLKSFRQNLISLEPSDAKSKIHDFLLSKISAGPHGLNADRDAFFQSGEKTAEIPSVKYVCERVFATAEQHGLLAGVSLDTCVHDYFNQCSVDPTEFWMELENEFALEIHDDDIKRAQAFSSIVRMIHVRRCKVRACISVFCPLVLEVNVHTRSALRCA
jgi:WD40 repeat protein